MKAIITTIYLIFSFNLFASPFEAANPSDAPAGLIYNVKQPKVENPDAFVGKKVAILVSHGVQESEITYPYTYLVTRGAKVEILSPTWTNNKVLGVKYLKPTIWIKTNGSFEDHIEHKYDLIILTGGAWNSNVVRKDISAITLIQKNYKNGSIIAAICAGSQILINANLTNNINLTGTGSIKSDLVNAGANFIDKSAVTDGNIITSRGPSDVLEFMQAIHTKL